MSEPNDSVQDESSCVMDLFRRLHCNGDLYCNRYINVSVQYCPLETESGLSPAIEGSKRELLARSQRSKLRLVKYK